MMAPVMATVAPKGMVIVTSVMGLLGLSFILRDGRLRDAFPRGPSILVGIVVGWMLIRSIDTTAGGDVWTKSFAILALCIAGFAIVFLINTLDRDQRLRLMHALTIGSVVTLAIILVGSGLIKLGLYKIFPIERAERLSIFNTGLVVLGAVTPSVCVYLYRLRGSMIAAVFALAVLVASVVIGATTVTVAVTIVGVVGLVCKSWDSSTFARLAGVIIVAGTIASPMALPLLLDRIEVQFFETDASGNIQNAENATGSILHRYKIWRFTLDRAMENPILGWGFDSSRQLPGGHFTFDIGKELMPLHPHNALLQIWVEIGLPGLLLYALVIWFAVVPRRNHDYIRGGQNVRTLTVLYLFLISNATFGIWQSWWLSSIILAYALTTCWYTNTGSGNQNTPEGNTAD